MSMREFETGATRNRDDNKYDYEGFLSPLAMKRYGQYMHEHRKQADGKLRDSDNWQKGIPKAQYIKSILRHAFDAWAIHRGWGATNPDTGAHVTLAEALCGLKFNTDGLLHEIMKDIWINETLKKSGCQSNQYPESLSPMPTESGKKDTEPQSGYSSKPRPRY